MNKIPAKVRRGRPPKILRENQDTKAELIRSGVELITKQGFTASGIDQILKKIGVPKGSFYHYFASKEAFGIEVIASYTLYFNQKLDKHLTNDTLSPLQRIEQFVNDAKSGMERYQFKRGCLIGNLEQEVSLLPNSYRQQLINTLAQWQKKMADCLLLAQHEGEISQDTDCQALAEYFWIGWEGAVSRAKLVKSSQPLTQHFHHFIMGLPR